MNQKMPYFGLHDPQHLVCLSRNRMYVNLMNLESGDCVTTFKAGEDRFLNSLLVSGDGRWVQITFDLLWYLIASLGCWFVAMKLKNLFRFLSGIWLNENFSMTWGSHIMT